ncbi:MAG: hypothetical protein Q4G30_06735 [Actinomycetaceae bacterium]|nr:hypothetical protein [Actinomycetaceae bacterium]
MSSFSAEERAAMKEYAAEKKRASKRRTKAEREAEEAQAMIEVIDKLPEGDKEITQAIAQVVAETAPQLKARTWYGMPAWSLDGDVLCFVQPASKFKVRYTTLGFSETAKLDEGDMWPTSYAITALTDTVKAQIARLVNHACGQVSG